MFGWLKKKSKKIVNDSGDLIGVKSIINNSAEIKDMAKNVFSPKEQIKDAREETFKEAKERLQVTDSDLVLVYKNYVKILYISLALSVFLFFFVLYSLFVKHNIISGLSGLVFIAFCLANAFKFSFRSFQIKHQKLCSVKEWYDRPNEWLPK